MPITKEQRINISRGRTGKGLRNKNAFGNKFNLTIEQRKKIGLGNKGKKRSLAIRKKISESMKGRISPRKGIQLTEEIKSKIIKTMNERGVSKLENNANWRGGISFEPYTIDWTETLKRAIRERDRYLCKICNSYGNIVHHIDYNKKNCNSDNLITLCNSCHTKTGYNRNYWINYFKNYGNIF